MTRTCAVTVKCIYVAHYRKILLLILGCDHVHCLTRGIMSTGNLRRCNPACKVVHMVAVQNQMEFISNVFQVQFNTRRSPITRISSSNDASSTRHTQEFNHTAVHESTGAVLRNGVSEPAMEAQLFFQFLVGQSHPSKCRKRHFFHQLRPCPGVLRSKPPALPQLAFTPPGHCCRICPSLFPLHSAQNIPQDAFRLFLINFLRQPFSGQI